MKNTYFDLIEQSYYFPQEGFDLHDGYLTFHGVSIKYLIEKYGTPFRLMYLPRIGDQIKKARNLFNRAIKANNYAGDYNYCYCTKCCHFHHVIGAALKQKVHLETSSSFDIDLIEKLIADFNPKSLTLDNDISFQKHPELSELIKATVYFCHPQAPYEKGTVENRNKAIRRYVKKKSDLSKYGNEYFKMVETKLRNRFMKCLNYRTPEEVFQKEILKQKKPLVCGIIRERLLTN